MVDMMKIISVIDNYRNDDLSCPLDIRLKTGELIETDAADCDFINDFLKIHVDENRGRVFYYITIESIAYIKAYDREWG